MLRPYANPFSKCPIPVAPDKVGAFLSARAVFHAKQAARAQAIRDRVMEFVSGLDRLRIGDVSRIAREFGIGKATASRAIARYSGGPVFPSKGNARRGKKFPRNPQ